MRKPETRIIPEGVPPKFFAEHLKVYEFLKGEACGKKVLEIGCGDGYGAAYLADAALEVTAVDYEEGVVTAARVKYGRPNLKFLPMEGGGLRFWGCCFCFFFSFLGSL